LGDVRHYMVMPFLAWAEREAKARDFSLFCTRDEIYRTDVHLECP